MARPGISGRCKTCRSPDRARIELLLARGASKRAIAEKFGLKPDAVWRHWHNGHVSEAVKSALVAKALRPGVELEKLVTDESIGLLENLQRIPTLYGQFDAAAEAGDRHNVGILAARRHENLRIAATSTGELQKHAPTNVTNILMAPAYLDLRSSLLGALRRFPEAARAVAEVFRRSEAPLIEGRNASA